MTAAPLAFLVVPETAVAARSVRACSGSKGPEQGPYQETDIVGNAGIQSVAFQGIPPTWNVSISIIVSTNIVFDLLPLLQPPTSNRHHSSQHCAASHNAFTFFNHHGIYPTTQSTMF